MFPPIFIEPHPQSSLTGLIPTTVLLNVRAVPPLQRLRRRRLMSPGDPASRISTPALSFHQQRTPGRSRHSGSDMEAVALMFNWSNGLYLILLNEATLLGNEL